MAMLLFVNLYCATAVLVVRKDLEPGDTETVEILLERGAVKGVVPGLDHLHVTAAACIVQSCRAVVPIGCGIDV